MQTERERLLSRRRHLRALVRDALLAALLIASKEMLAGLPNVELVSLLVISYTVVYRARALVPIYVFVAVEAVVWPSPFGTAMYLYVWAILFLVILFLSPREKLRPAWVYALVSGFFGLLFGVLCAPAQAVLFGLDVSGTLAWIAAGLPWDAVHGVTNAALALLVPPLSRLLLRLEAGATV